MITNAVTLEQGVTVTQLKGQIYLVAADGSRKLLAEGDVLPKGAVIMSPDGASFMGGGQSFNVQPASEQSEPAEEGDAPQLAQNGAAGTPDEINALQQAILGGADPTQAFEASAAGGAPAAGGGGIGGVAGASGNGGFVTIDRTGSATIAEATFDTTYNATGEPPLEAVGEDDPLFTSANLVLSADPQVNEGGLITFTATLDEPVFGSDLVIQLSNGAVITIPVGQSSGSVTVAAPADSPYVDPSTITVSITGTQGGGFNQIITSPSTTTQINDTVDTTTVTLSAPAQVNEGGQITYSASVNNAPQSDLVLTLSNGSSITIKAGELSGSVTVDAPSDDVYKDGSSLTVSITGSQGGNYEQLDTSSTVTTEVGDTVDTTTVTLSGPGSVVEGETTATYTVTLSDAAPVGSIVTLSYTYTSASGKDITETTQAVIGADGKTATFTIATVDDKFAEGDEKFSVSVSGVQTPNGSNVFEKLDLSGASVETTIKDAASPVDPEVSGVEDTVTVTLSGPGSVVEGETTATYTVTLSDAAPVGSIVTLSYSYTTASGKDITETIQAVIGADGKTATFTIDTINDGIYEGDENFSVSVSKIQTLTGFDVFELLDLSSATADTAIIDAQAAPVVGIVANQESVTEGEVAGFTVSLDQKADEPVVVTFTYSGVAKDGSDFSGVATVTIPAGSISVPLNIDTIDDGIYEGAESFTVTISGVSGADATVGANSSADTAIIDAQAAPVVGIVANQESVTEGEVAGFTVSLDQKADEPVVVTFTYSGVAKDGSDFSGVATVTIPAGSISVPLNIDTIDDGIYEGAESFTVTISGVSGADATVGANSSADTAIIDAQAAPVVGIVANQESVTEGEVAGFTVSLDQKADEPVVVTFTYSGVAKDGSDFSGVATVTIPAGSISVPLNIDTIDDGIYEGAESFTVTISGVSGADATVGANSSADTAIIDAQAAPVVGIVANQESVTEGEVAGFTVSLDQKADEPVVVTFTYSGVAKDGSDFSGVATVTIPAGSISVPLNIDTIDDGIYEGAESFTVTISGVSGADATVGANSSADTAIIDAQAAPVVGIVANQESVTEGEVAGFTVSLDQKADEPVVVTFTYSGVAKDGSDFSGVATVTIPAGSISVPLNIDTIDDGIYEGAESFTVTISGVSGADATVGANSSADTAIIDAQAAPVVGIVANQESVTEGEVAGFTVSLDQKADEPVVVTFTYSGVAKDGSDFSGVATVTIPAGSISVPLNIDTIDDGIYEGAESFTVTISGVSGADATVGANSSADTAIIDAQAAPVVGIVANQESVTEGEVAGFTVSLDQKADEPVVVTFTYSGVAKDGSDFSGVATVTIPAGSISVPLNIDTIDDGIYEGAESFTVTISGVSGADATVGANSSADTAIIDAQAAPVVGIVANQESVTEGEVAGFTVSLDQKADEPVVVTFTYSGVAKDGSDFSGVATVTIPAGSISVPLNIDTIDDGIYEGAESFTVTISGVSGADATVGANSSADTAIIDAQAAPVVGIVANQESVTEGEVAGFTVSLDQKADEPVVVTFTYSGVAKDGSDFSGVATVTIPAGSISVPLNIDTIDDGIYEGAESFTVTISGVSGADATVGANSSADTAIIDAQAAPVVGIVANQESVTEGEVAGFTVSLDQKADEPVVVTFTYSGVAKDGSDFSGVATVTIPAGSISVPLNIDTIDDGIYEGAESFTVTISGVSGADATVGANSSADTAIIDAQAAPVVGIVANQESVTEGEVAGFTVSLDQKADEPVVVTFTYSGVAKDGSDFSGVATVTIPAGSISVPLNIDTIDDGIYEGAESFTVTISGVSGADATVGANSSADTAIIDAQAAPVVGIVANQESVTEGEVAGFTVSLDQKADEPVVVTFTYSGVAKDGSDFSGVATVTIPAGSISVPLNIGTIDDGIYEGAESFTVTISGVSGADATVGANSSADTAIIDAQAAPVVGIVANQESVTEGEVAGFTVSLDQKADEPVVVTFTYSGVAKDGSDFSGVATVTIPAGSISVPLNIDTIDDGIYEGAESFTVTISGVSGADATVGANSSADTAIIDAQAAPVVGIVANQESVTEGEVAGFTVSLDQKADEPVVVTFTYSGVAKDGSDFSGVATVTIPAGSISVPLNIGTIDDGIYEGAESFTVTISGVSGADATVGANSSADTAIIDAQAAPVVGIVANQESVTEGEVAGFTVSLDQKADEPVVVTFTYSGVAKDGSDFSGVATVTIPAGSISVPLNIGTIDDGIYEGAESFTVTISGVSGADATVGANSSADTAIIDAQAAPVVGIVANQESVTEGEVAGFTVSLDQKADEPVVVTFTYSGVAKDGSDFSGVATVTIPAGSISVPLNIGTIDDGIYEGAESFTVTISGVSGADATVGANSSADTAIIDAQAAPVVGIVANQESVTEGEVAGFTVSLDQKADEPVVVTFTYSGVAKDGSDFSGVATVTIPAGSISVPLNIGTIDDGIYEGAESFTVTISGVSGADATVGANSSADTAIIDAQAAPVVGIVANQESVTEGEVAGFTVSLDQKADEPVVVTFTYSGVAKDGSDFSGVATVTIPAGSISVPLNIDTIDDGIYEGAESFTVTISGVSGADATVGANSSADTAIIDAQAAPVVGIVANQESVTEGEVAGFTVSLDQKADEPVVVTFTYSGVAKDGSDFSGVATVTIPAGSISVPLNIDTIDDGIYEGAESFTVTISGVSGADATVGANSSADTAIIDAQAAPVVGIVANQESVTEGEVAGFTVSLDQKADEPVVVTFTYSGVAKDGSDFSGVATVTIPAGSISVPLNIDTIDDGIYEGAESFTVTISGVSGADATVGANSSADTAIIDAQAAPVVGIVANQESVTEGEVAGFTVSLDQKADEPVVVTFTYSGVAKDGSDFSGVATVTIPAGSISVPLNIGTIDDGIYEGAESFTVTISGVSGADATVGANSSADTAIIDAQAAPVVGIVANQESVTEGEVAGFTVSLDQKADEPVVVTFTYSGVAKDGSDFSGVATVTIPAGSISVPLNIDTIDDGIYEGAESFTVTISGVSGADATVGANSSADTAIIDAQAAPVVGIVANQESVTEGEVAGFTVSLDQKADEPVVVTFTYSGVAKDGSDFSGVATVTIPAGSISVPLNIGTIDDGIYEGAESFTVTISGVSGADATVGANSSADTAIIDAQAAPVVGIVANQESVTEGEVAGFTVSLDQKADEPVVVTFTYSGVAKDGSDFSGVATVTIPAGSISVPLNIDTIDDGIYEGAESFTVTISGVSGADATVGANSSADTAIIDAQAAPVVGIVANQESVTEGEVAGFTVSLDQKADEPVVVTFTYSGVAKDGSDFSGVATVTIPAGSISVPLNIGTIDDGIYEGAESFTVTISGVSGADATVGANSSADTAIIDAQAAPVVGIVANQESVTEGEVAGFTVSLDQKADEPVVVTFTYSGVAKDGSDFSGVATVTIPAGSISVPLNIGTIDDGIYEGAESFTVTISGVSGADATVGANSSADTAIIDAQAAPVVGIVANQESVTEGEVAGFTVSLDQKADEPVVVTFTYSGVAKDGSDFSGVATVTIPAGSISVPLNIDTIDDGIYEGAESFTVTISGVSGADATVGANSSADTAIIDAQAAPVVGIVANQESVTEGEVAGFTVSLDQKADEPVVVTFTYSGVAKDGSDFSGVATVTIPAGSISVPLNIDTIDDGIYEGAESFTVTISGVSGADATVGANSSADTAIIDAQAAPVVGIVANQESVTEGEVAGFTVSLDQKADEPVVVTFTYSGVAKDGSDFSGVATVTIPAGSISVPLNIDTIDDGIYEGAESFTVTISGVSGADATVGANSSADTAIIDAQAAPVVGIVANQESVTEGEVAGFTVSLDQKADEPVVVTFTYSGVAKDGSDFSGVATVTIPAGSISVPLNIDTIDDGIYEGAESFTVTISGVSGADATVGANSSADTAIIDAQAAPVVGIVANQESVTEGEVAGFTVSLDQKADEPVVVTFTYSGVAKDGSDFSGVATVTIPAGSISVPLNIGTIDDGIYEGAESFTVTISGVSGADATVGANSSADTAIIDAQAAPVVGIVANQESVTEGEVAGFTVSLDQKADEPVVVTFTYSGVAKDGSDFSGVATVTIPAGSISVPLNIDTIDDGIYEGAESFTVTISGVSGADATVGANSSADTAIIDAQAAPVVGIVANQESVTEGEVAGFTVSLDQKADEPVVVTFTYSGVAKDGSDFSGVATVTIPAGSISVPLNIDTIDDGIYEGAESFTVTISGVSGADATVGANSSADTAIIDAQAAPVVGIVANQESVTEGEVAGFTVSLDQKADEPVVVTFTYSGVAKDGSDFSGVATVTIPAGSISVPLNIGTIDDGIYEGAESFTVTISGVSGADATVGANSSTGTIIIDNDSVVALQDVIEGTAGNVLNVADGVAFTGTTALGGLCRW
ncbi:hypothetical protein CK911_00750 [Aeromonas sp. CU5]|uniref:Calx-beta domain-containing protein n=1 Tax=Aeromonas sp. CU5 TaxID=2033033 RepID=UPI000BFB8AF4|nr:Calx-beta domain-containing protein [Aeromonas sp. CU5]ATL91501.1 hypothetical protein CK911_00750 [Aeromonas sp. CU5]